jgi:AbiV family abortive infection protein
VIVVSRQVPRARMQEGIDLCKTNISDFLKDARLILAQNRLNHAYVITEFAVEEFGKAAILKEAWATSSTDPIVLGENVFTSHKGKSAKAWTVLDPNYRRFWYFFG